MTYERKISWITGILCVVIVWLLMAPAWVDADEGHGHHHDDDDGGDTLVNVDVPVDVDITGPDIGGDSVRSLVVVAPPLGDVDIAQCLGSTQFTFLVGGKQKLVLNWPCMAEFYLKQGRYDLAAQALCNQPEIIKEYMTEVACEIDHDFSPPETDGEGEGESNLGGLYNQAAQFNEHYERAQQQQEEIEYLREENASIIGQIEYITQQIEQAPAPQQQVQQQIDEGAERRAKSRAAYEKALAEGSEE